MARTKKQAAAKPPGPAVMALVRAWDKKNRMELTASVKPKAGGRIDLQLSTWDREAGWSGWSPHGATGPTAGSGETIRFWGQRSPRKELAGALMKLVASWSTATLQPETVKVESRKNPIRGKALRELAVAAFCEAYGVASPDPTALQRLGRSSGKERRAFKEQLVKELARGKRGVAVWNRRDAASWISLGNDLSFGARALDGAALDGINLQKVSLAGSSLRKTSLRKSNLEKCNLSGVSAAGADFSGSDGYQTNFTKADLTGARFGKAVLSYPQFQNATLVAADFRDADLEHADFRAADLSKARLGADLTFADLTGAILTGADFAGADLSNSTLHDADLGGADLRRATLAIVEEDYTLGSRFDVYKGARYDGRTRFPRGYDPPANLVRVGRGTRAG